MLDSQTGPLLTAVEMSIPDLHLTLPIHVEFFRSVALKWDYGCRSNHGHARSYLGERRHVSQRKALAPERCAASRGLCVSYYRYGQLVDVRWRLDELIVFGRKQVSLENYV